MFERALVPLDGSAFAEAAVPWVSYLPVKSALLARVEPDLPMAGGELAGFGYEEGHREEADSDRSALDRSAQPLRAAGIPVETRVVFNDHPDEALVAAAAADGVDLVIMTTHGRGAAGRAIHGSTADRVARHASVPVLLIRPDANPQPPARVVVPTDGSALSETALPLAAGIARDRNLPLHLLRVLDMNEVLREIRENNPDRRTAPADDAWDVARAEAEAEATAKLEALLAPYAAEGIRTGATATVGSAAQTMIDWLQPNDLTVMTTHGETGLRRILVGSVAEEVVRHAKSPVLLVRLPEWQGGGPGSF